MGCKSNLPRLNLESMWLYVTHLKFELLMSELWGQFTNTQRVHNVLESEELKQTKQKL